MSDSGLSEFLLKKMDLEMDDQDLDSLLKGVRTHLGMEVAFIGEFSDGQRIISYVNTDHGNLSIAAGMSSPLSQTYCHKIVEGLLPRLIPDAIQHPITKDLKVTKSLKIGAYVGVPIRLTNDAVYGTLCCYSPQPDPSLQQKDVSFLELFADMLGKQLSRKRDEKQLKTQKLQRVKNVMDNVSLNMVYQPILSLETGNFLGFEALTRFTDEPYRSPDIWFKEAAEVGLGENLELLAIRKALQHSDRIPRGSYLSINISAEYLLKDQLMALLSESADTRIMFEVTEHEKILDYSKLSDALCELREQGIRIALDDAGAGYASFQHILDLQVDVLKLDLSLIRNIHLDKRRQALAAGLIAFAQTTGVDVIAEGIEQHEELKTLRALGVSKMQGYLIGRPMPFEEAMAHRPLLS
ncbi:EAL domain-containing protein [Aliiglaciecola sp. CAU 1673]|uniref:sensor domain-containing phosphodiesterase n=1 Tax=Aliiglaciecola sp. CAU 1673 TaxID=3032595 RepID=UPI0023DA3B91|nr:EAL domain-containing protein [Aliiglaciecola sp. CAU 1673]MDF2178351.1 EAL domain-containing protein [Aliiglaciecola sp. CAU 1673]